MTGNNWLQVFRGEIDCSVILCVLTTPSTDTYCSLCSTLLCLTPHSSDSFSCREDRPGLWFIPISTRWPGRSAHSGMQIVFNSRLKCLVHHKCMVNVSCSWLYICLLFTHFFHRIIYAHGRSAEWMINTAHFCTFNCRLLCTLKTNARPACLQALPDPDSSDLCESLTIYISCYIIHSFNQYCQRMKNALSSLVFSNIIIVLCLSSQGTEILISAKALGKWLLK